MLQSEKSVVKYVWSGTERRDGKEEIGDRRLEGGIYLCKYAVQYMFQVIYPSNYFIFALKVRGRVPLTIYLSQT